MSYFKKIISEKEVSKKYQTYQQEISQTYKYLDRFLQEYQLKFPHVLDQLEIGIWIVEKNAHETTFLSKEFESIFNLDLQAFYQEPYLWKKFVFEEDQAEFKQKYELLDEGKEIKHYYRIQLENDEMKWIYEHVIPQENEMGDGSYLIGVIYDVTLFFNLTLEVTSPEEGKLASLIEENILTKDLYQAIQDQAFELYYQPLVNPMNGEMEGAEALIRWNHHHLGLIPPKKFIPLAEKNELIHLLENWVIQTVCKQLNEWRKKGYKLFPISVNISPVRFAEKGVEHSIENTLRMYQIPSKYLVVEITEDALLKNEENVLTSLNYLKKLGVRIALDDFGTGFSSLSYLRNFEADMLKIDRSFIKDLYVDCKRNAVITTFLIQLAKSLNMKIVAEGVEEYEQLEFLKKNKCDIIQGYIYSKPVPVKQFEQIIQNEYLQPQYST